MINNTWTVWENKDIQTGKKIWTNISDRINFDNIWDETALDQAIRLILEFKFKYWLDYHVFFISENIIDINEEKNSDFNKIYRFVEDSNLSWNVLQNEIKVLEILDDKKNNNETLEGLVSRLKDEYFEKHKVDFELNIFINQDNKGLIEDNYILQTLIKSNYNLYTAEIQESQERLEPQSKIIWKYVKEYIAKILGHN
jgi:hypothetical protein